MVACPRSSRRWLSRRTGDSRRSCARSARGRPDRRGKCRRRPDRRAWLARGCDGSRRSRAWPRDGGRVARPTGDRSRTREAGPGRTARGRPDLREAGGPRRTRPRSRRDARPSHRRGSARSRPPVPRYGAARCTRRTRGARPRGGALGGVAGRARRGRRRGSVRPGPVTPRALAMPRRRRRELIGVAARIRGSRRCRRVAGPRVTASAVGMGRGQGGARLARVATAAETRIGLGGLARAVGRMAGRDAWSGACGFTAAWHARQSRATPRATTVAASAAPAGRTPGWTGWQPVHAAPARTPDAGG